MTRICAPIALFVYARPDHTRRTVEALQRNHLAGESELVIFSDAPKRAEMAAGVESVRRYIRTLDGFKSTRAAIALAWGEWDIDATAGAGMPTQSVAIHDELCKLEGPKAKDGVGHCPTMMWFKGESHMSEVFSFGSIDKTVSDQVLAFIKNHH